VVVGAISVSGPEQRIEHLMTEDDLAARVQRTAREASIRLGYPGGDARVVGPGVATNGDDTGDE
jgi:hypothetical protein